VGKKYDQLIDNVYTHLSNQHIDTIHVTQFVRIWNISRSTLYVNFDGMEDLYLSSFEKKIVAKASQNSNSLKEFVEELIKNINQNKVFCRNCNNLNEKAFKKRIIENYIKLEIERFNLIANSNKASVIFSLTYLITKWFEEDLKIDVTKILNELNNCLEN
jgi:dihydroxyacetone kinase-like predicted kinase